MQHAPTSNADDDQRILRRVLGGDTEAFGVLVSRYQRPVYSLLLRASGCPEQAQDLAQEAFVKAFQKLHTFHLGRPFLPWLCSIAMNQARDFLRRQARTPEVPDTGQGCEAAPEDDQQDRMARQLDGRKAALALRDLPLDYREALVLRYRQGMTMKEIGQALGITSSGAKMRVRRGLDMLKVRLEQGVAP